MWYWKKPDGIRYTEMCIYVDKHVPELVKPDCPEEVPDTIYNYLWLLVKALAIKKRMFTNYNDYDGYAFYAAKRLYFALKRNLENQGKRIKGKDIKPIKSCLNYTKVLLYPMKLEYLKQEYNINVGKQKQEKKVDSFVYREQVRSNIWYQEGGLIEFRDSIANLFRHLGNTVERTLMKSPYTKDSPEFKNLKISVLLNIVANIKDKKPLNNEPLTPILWKLPKSQSEYIKILIREVGELIKKEVQQSYNGTYTDDRILEYIVTNPYGEFINHEDQ